MILPPIPSGDDLTADPEVWDVIIVGGGVAGSALAYAQAKTWCGPCLLLAKELEKVAETMDGKVKVVKIDVDENPDLANMLKIQGLPTIVFIPKENGKPALRTEGWLPAAQIMEIVGQMDAGQVAAPPMPSAAPEAAQ
ncbi:Thioredoxin-like protein CITRX, chloroplastic [Tetrabaena socialis]|uniref:Thioredoxin-like protein CITRX, chloroplastic n=1 Tax=Tetrabaena socialis TaxID=47790 RepID=A0A2J7ZXG8_9CHLO|nr:Thioredoxin-like protein CITRX, chloroplastic [Tetrabaena socialis]|eukprot:PNH04970.1 Thioredoxin-like protein CITRX, chloroplastic [Tetrabaena socialis]